MDVFQLRERLVRDYQSYISSFIQIRDSRIKGTVDEALDGGLLWPDPLIQLNPAFEPGKWIDELVDEGLLHQECRRIFRIKPQPPKESKGLRLHRHQEEAIRAAQEGHNYVLTTGTGSGKSLAYIIPIVDYALRRGSGGGIKAIVVYPMNALANSQEGELRKFLCQGYPDGVGPITFARYTGQESDERKQAIIADPPDILLTNYVMLELLLTRPQEKPLVKAARGLQFLVLDELHTYRGRQGADVAMLVRRCRESFEAESLQCVGTSATLAGVGSYEQQRAEVAGVASMIFGAPVLPQHVTGETLQRATDEPDLADTTFLANLKKSIENPESSRPSDFQSFLANPLSAWIESTFGLTKEEGTGRLIRSAPRSITGEQGAAKELGELTGLPESQCTDRIGQHLIDSYEHGVDPATESPAFAFRLHQFVSRGDTVYASLESEPQRYVTVYGQQYVPGDRTRVLLPLVFCRECGQEYYCVRATRGVGDKHRVFEPRELGDRLSDEDSEAGFIYASAEGPWPVDLEEVLTRLPEDWLEEYRGKVRVRKSRQKYLPQAVRVTTDGREAEQGLACQYIPRRFSFCLHCGVSYGVQASSDFAKLTTLSMEGRSTATTILSLAVIRYLRDESTLADEARKLLSFTDNRQDASLQAGHFNDFVEIGLLRAALFKAAHDAGPDGLRYDTLVEKAFDALDLPLDFYASDPAVLYRALEDTKGALRAVLGYRLYRDLKRGWRVTLPNLEQCGLLEIEYDSLSEVCRDESIWKGLHPALASASPTTREAIAKTLLDYGRRELAIKVEYLDRTRQERIQQQSWQFLKEPWAIDEEERMEHAAILYPRSRRAKDYAGNAFLSGRSGFGQYLRRSSTFQDYGQRLTLDESEELCRQLLEVLRIVGLTEAVAEEKGPDGTPGYQIRASGLIWRAGDGTRPFWDPIRVPRQSEEGGSTNPFFKEMYKGIALKGKGLEAREHTAAVPYDVRMEREERFREGRLPVLYCSPTMELGVDIAELNVVNLRNVPPTPANYAQRSGRAGRGGRNAQPALVFSYCSTFSSHDQYFFKRPGLMVMGAVTPPRLDLANEDLIRAHIHAIWLAETNLPLGSSLIEILDVDGTEPTLQLRDHIRDALKAMGPRQKARERAERVLASMQSELEEGDWYSAGWLDEVLGQVSLHFEWSCDRWRNLYRAALRQRTLQHSIISDASRPADERRKAKRLRAEAESQIELLTEARRAIQSDFYSYRYFASEGFLPGYSFPRLPLSAYIPGRRIKTGDSEYISRPRFLAISEFGPRAILYHEGSRYRIEKVFLPVEDRAEDGLATGSVKLCSECGYLHPISQGDGPDLCDRCGETLEIRLRDMFRLQNVSTRRAERISSDEEERRRIGYEVVSCVRFATRDGRPSYRTAVMDLEGEEAATLAYGHAATLWRVNLGWRHRAVKHKYGFILDTERGYWARNESDSEDDAQDPLPARTRRVIPYVEDSRNCLLFEPSGQLSGIEMASLQAALKKAIQIEYQLEDSELAAEPLPSRDNRRILLFYEAAEGGAGVLRRLVDDPESMQRISRRALDLCHFDADTLDDLRRAPGAREDCEAACYDCMMSYSNQMDHRLLDRHAIRDFLQKLGAARLQNSPGPLPRAEHLSRLMRQCASDLERAWLQFLEDHDLALPAKAQVLIENCRTRPDFLYHPAQVAVYVDGPHHDYPDRQNRDQAQTECMENLGYVVVRFGHRDDWKGIVEQFPETFGRIS
ncbi:MAG: DEAD/DEAH box helicase [Candidatus Eisenbacteria sp.]|nr:DEAD/DEAH box helicase [Candidatus Eisenbacteria bacterium]